MTTPRTRSLLAASNRGPIALVSDDHGGTKARRGGGGLVSAMQSALSANDGLWVCSALNDRERTIARRAADGRLAEAGIDVEDLEVRMLPIDAVTFGRAYNGIANSTLWFIHHLLYDIPTKPVFDAAWRRQWAAYERFNDTFARALAEDAAEGATVMVQDYHLLLTPRLLRDKRPDVRIGHFTHTPWSVPDYYTMLPEDVASSLLTGMLGADHLGFHSKRWAQAFIGCCRQVLGAEVTDAAVDYDGHRTHIGVHPLGTDAGELRERASRRDVERSLSDLKDIVGDRKVISRVDRTELSKNIVRGMLAYRELLRSRPEWQGRVVHVVYTYPSREDVPEYREYTAVVERLGREIEDEFSTDDWDSLVLEVGHDYPGSLAALRMADVLLINPVRDGMNLVAQEGCILSENEVALVLSREAGAYDLMGEHALVVNPYDVSGTAAQLHEALLMPAEERAARRERMVAAATSLPPAEWFDEQIAAVRQAF
ncbi:MAG TPA: trehalose-6-phosphate synthase [Mycobacteriales bacterium]|nr:trehalose-6-phosphate synthase [Mycobacteriales bacterium]